MTAEAQKIPVEDRDRALAHSRKAISMLDKLKLTPNPDNYALFFHYAMGMNVELTREIDTAIENKLPFMPHVLKNLHTKYVIANNNQRLLNEVTSGTNKMLGEVLRIVGDFSSQTTDYSKNIDGYMTQLEQNVEDTNLKEIVRGLVSATSSIKQRSEALSSKLAESKQEVEVLRKNLEQVSQESQRDFLTGIFNRKALDAMLLEHFNHKQEPLPDFSLLMLDVDHFKQFNDKFGHLLGDEVLKIVARAVTYCIRGKDIVARYGGEEFCVLLHGTPLAGAAKVAENIRATIASRDLKRKDTGESYGSITVSIGASQMNANDTPQSLMKRADEALYRSKHNGRNRVTLENE